MSKKEILEEDDIDAILLEQKEKLRAEGKIKPRQPVEIRPFGVCTRCGYPFMSEEEYNIPECPKCGHNAGVIINWSKS